MKTYILQKNIQQPNDVFVSEGTEFTKSDTGVDSPYISSNNLRVFHPSLVENNPEWFKEKEGPQTNDKVKQNIINTIIDLVSSFTYYDRKEDEDLDRDQLQEAVKTGVITVDEMVEEFRKHLQEAFND